MHIRVAGRLAGAIAGLALLMAPAAAQGPTKWSGFYIGAHSGYSWGAWNGSMIYTDAQPNDGFDAGGKTINGDGVVAGGQVGFNVQSGSFVWGLEIDGSWTQAEGSTTLLPYPVGYPNNGAPAWGFAIENNWLATVRARVGVTSGSLLFYGTGGVAFGGFSSSHTVLGYNYPDNALSTREDTKTGWTAGLGVEWAINSSWSAKAEYLYLSFPDVGGIMQWAPKYGPATDGFQGDWNVQSVRVGINYKLN